MCDMLGIQRSSRWGKEVAEFGNCINTFFFRRWRGPHQLPPPNPWFGFGQGHFRGPVGPPPTLCSASVTRPLLAPKGIFKVWAKLEIAWDRLHNRRITSPKRIGYSYAFRRLVFDTRRNDRDYASVRSSATIMSSDVTVNKSNHMPVCTLVSSCSKV